MSENQSHDNSDRPGAGQEQARTPSAGENQAREYWKLVEARFTTEPEKYKEFLDILSKFNQRQYSVTDARKAMSQLFEGDSDLIEGFDYFLPTAGRAIGISNTPLAGTPEHTVKAVSPSAPFGSAPPADQETPVPQANRRVKFENALAFLEEVKLVFAETPNVYNDFLNIMKRFKSQELDTPGVISAVKILFDGHPDLVNGFNVFLPPGYQIGLNEAPVASTAIPATTPVVMNPPPTTHTATETDFDQARNFVMTVKTRFANQPAVYRQFLEILHEYHREGHSVQHVHAVVNELFYDQPDLQEAFKAFLPSTEPAVGTSGAAPANATRKPGHTLKTASPPVPVVSPPARDQDRPAPQANRRVKFENALSFLEEVKLVFAETPNVYSEFLNIMKRFKSQELDTPGVISAVKILFDGHPDLVNGFNVFLPPGYQIGLNEAPVAVTPIPVQVPPENNAVPDSVQAQHFVKTVKARFADQPDVYRQFLQILHEYHSDGLSLEHVHTVVDELFYDYPDLQEGFKAFLPSDTMKN